jgi:hypothetical protein
MRRFSGVAALLFASAACGKTTALSDAPTGDSKQADSGTGIDAAPAPVTVITKSRSSSTSPQGTLVPGVSVYAVQPSGGAGPTGQTDSNGKVVLDGVDTGASITAVYALSATSYQLVTVVGVKPGDTITLGEQYGTALPGGNTGNLTVTFPTFPNASSYAVYSPCNSLGGAGSPLTLAEGCTVATVNLLLVAVDATGNAIAGGVIKNVNYTDGQTAALTAWTAVPTGGFQVSISGLISDVSQASLFASMELDGTTSYGRSAFISPLTAGAATSGVPVPIGGDRTYAYATLYRGTTGFGTQETYTSVGPTATSATFPAPGLPWLGARQLDAAGQSVQWLQSGGTGYDAGFANIQWIRTDATTGAQTNYNWNVLVPPGQTQFSWAGTTTIAALAPYLPATTDTFQQFHVKVIDLANATDYDQVRADPEWQWQSPGNSTEVGELSGVSSVAYGAEGNTTTGSIRPTHAR